MHNTYISLTYITLTYITLTDLPQSKVVIQGRGSCSATQPQLIQFFGIINYALLHARSSLAFRRCLAKANSRLGAFKSPKIVKKRKLLCPALFRSEINTKPGGKLVSIGQVNKTHVNSKQIRNRRSERLFKISEGM